MIGRRAFLGALVAGIATTPRAAGAQPGGKVYRIAYLGNSSPAQEADLLAAFRQGLRDLNYVEGQTSVSTSAVAFPVAVGVIDRRRSSSWH